jgi:hypothetical protein
MYYCSVRKWGIGERNLKTHCDVITEDYVTEILFKNYEKLRKSSVIELWIKNALMQDYGMLWKEREKLNKSVPEAGVATDSKVILNV